MFKPVKQLHNGVLIIAISIIWFFASLFMVMSDLYALVGWFVSALSGAFLLIGIDICKNNKELDKYVKGDLDD